MPPMIVAEPVAQPITARALEILEGFTMCPKSPCVEVVA
jgi:hypothetical protein